MTTDGPDMLVQLTDGLYIVDLKTGEDSAVLPDIDPLDDYPASAWDTSTDYGPRGE